MKKTSKKEEKRKLSNYIKNLEDEKSDLEFDLEELEKEISSTKLGVKKENLQKQIDFIDDKLEEIKPKRGRAYGDPIVELY